MGHSVQEYLASLHEWWDAVLQSARCPQCQCAYHRHQTRDRAAWEDCEHAQRLQVLRLACPTCGRTETVLPDFLTPYRRYRTDVREAVIAEEITAPPCDERTARRWVHAFQARMTEAIAALTACVLVRLPLGAQEPAFLHGRPPCFVTLRHLRALAGRHALDASASSLLGWTNQQLWPRHAWAL